LEDVPEESSAPVVSQEELIGEDKKVSSEQSNLFSFPFVVGNEMNRIADDLPHCMIGYLTVLDRELLAHQCHNSKCAVFNCIFHNTEIVNQTSNIII
jgi:hypothetical protein